MSAEFFYNYYQAFGLTQTTGIDLPYEAKGISKTQQEMEQVETDLYSTAFGQSQKLTLIQMAAAVASTVNGGYLMTPYVVDNMTDDTGNVVWQAETDIKRQVVSEEVSEQIRAMMETTWVTPVPAMTWTITVVPALMWRATASAANPVRQNSWTGKTLTSTARTATTARPSALPPSFRRTTRKFWCWS